MIVVYLIYIGWRTVLLILLTSIKILILQLPIEVIDLVIIILISFRTIIFILIRILAFN